MSGVNNAMSCLEVKLTSCTIKCLLPAICTWQEDLAKKLMKRLSNVKSPKKATKRPRQTGNAQPTENDASSDFEGDSSPAVLKS